MNSDGDGIFINLDELNRVKTVALESFTMQKFRHMCILSGCDYLPSIKGLGLYKAHKYLRKSTNVYKVNISSITYYYGKRFSSDTGQSMTHRINRVCINSEQ